LKRSRARLKPELRPILVSRFLLRLFPPKTGQSCAQGVTRAASSNILAPAHRGEESDAFRKW
jgi:hypothetical protein